jgi:hypothetical protein
MKRILTIIPFLFLPFARVLFSDACGLIFHYLNMHIKHVNIHGVSKIPFRIILTQSGINNFNNLVNK